MGAEALVRAALDAGMGTGAQLVAAGPDGFLRDVALGATGPGPDAERVTATTRFDVASVTKLFTTAVAAALIDDGTLSLDTPAGAVLPGIACPDVSVRALLGHRSGLPAWRPLFDLARHDPACAGLWPDNRTAGGTDRARARAMTLTAACVLAPTSPPARVYSDVGFLVLTAVLEAAGGVPLDALLDGLVTGPLGLRAGFRRLSSLQPSPSIPATGVLRPREPAPGQEDAYTVGPQAPQLVPGEVDDDNAWACDGVAGHAGVFASARTLAAFATTWWRAAQGDGTWLSPETAQAFLAVDAPDLAPARSLGWDRVAGEGSTAGSRLGRGPLGGVGHLGFTGASVWLDLDRGLAVALTTNRTLPSRTARAPIRALRPMTHDALWNEIVGT